MTGLLTDVMHDRADSLPPPDLDVAAMISDGERRLGRRRAGLIGLTAASLAVAAGITLPALLSGDARDAEVSAPVVSYDLAYAVGSTIHDGPRTVETDVPISALVQGISGYVVADRQGRVHTVLDGRTTQVGLLAATDRGRLVSDGDVVAWVDAADGGTLSVLDLATGERTDVTVDAFPGEPVAAAVGQVGGAGGSIAAVDGRTVYVSDSRGVMAWDALDDEDPVLIPAPQGLVAEVVDVQDGRILQVVRSFEPDESGGSTTMVQVERLRIGTDLRDTTLLPGTGGRLSPDGRTVALLDRVSQGGSPTFTTTTVHAAGDTWTPVDPPGYESVTAYHWLDGDTFAVGAGSYTADFAREDLLTCEASTAECTVVVRGVPEGLVAATGSMTP